MWSSNKFPVNNLTPDEKVSMFSHLPEWILDTIENIILGKSEKFLRISLYEFCKYRTINDKVHLTIKEMFLFILFQKGDCSLMRNISGKRKEPELLKAGI